MVLIGLEKYSKSDETVEQNVYSLFKIPVHRHFYRKIMLIMGSSELSYYPHALPNALKS